MIEQLFKSEKCIENTFFKKVRNSLPLYIEWKIHE